MPHLDQEGAIKAFAKLLIAAGVGAAIGVVVVHSTSARGKGPALTVPNDGPAAATPDPGYADWQGAIGGPFGARVITHNANGRFVGLSPQANPFDGMDKMQGLPAP